MKKKIFLALVLALLLPMAGAFSISPATAEIGKINNTFNLSVINTSGDSIEVTLDLGDFKQVAQASTESFTLLPQESSSVKIVFYDGISHKGTICVLSGGVSGKVGAAIKNCTKVTVNTTNQENPETTLDGSIGDNFVISQLIALDDLLLSKDGKINNLREMQLFDYYDELNPILLQLKQKRSEIAQSIFVKDVTSALRLTSEFYEIFNDLAMKEPMVKINATKTFNYFITSRGSQILDPDRKSEIKEVLDAAGISGESQVREIENQSDKIKVSRSILVLEVTDRETMEQFDQTNIKISLTNLTPNKVSNVKVVEFLPKEFALDISSVIIFSGSDIIQSDPVFELSAGDLEPGVRKNVFYKLFNKIEEKDFAAFKLPVVSVRGVRELQAEESKEVLGDVLDDLIEARKSELTALESQPQSGIINILVIFLAVITILIVISMNYSMRKNK